MAAQYDAFGTYLGDYETEEERKKREELANTAVHTTEVKTYGDGTQEKITKEEIPGAIQPRTVPTAAGPVSPDTFARMQQAESGGRDFDAQGRPLTSPAGAMFKNQVMPATAANPGFGVRPAQAQTPEEYNRVGQEYYQALLKKYNGNEQLATAAYNMGPGAVDQNIARNQGQFNVAQAPRETQGYLDKVFRGVGNVVNAVIPSAQAGTLPPGQAQRPATITPGAPVAPVAPGAMPQIAQVAPSVQPGMTIDEEGNRLIRNADGTTTVLGPDNKPLAAGGMEAQDTPQFRNRLFEEAGKDPFKWMEIAKNPEYSKFAGMQTVAKEQARNLFEQEFNMNKAKEQATQAIAQAASGDPKASRAIADELKNQDGSWVKMILLGFLSPQLAGEEAVKLGFGNKWVSQTDDKGNSVLIQVNAKGLPLKGYDSEGNALDDKQLIAFGGGKKELDIVGGTYVNDRTGEVGRVVTDKKTGQSFIQTDTGRKPMAGFRPQSSTGTLTDMRARQIQELNIKLQGKTLEEKMAILRPYNQALVGQGLPAIDPSEVGITAPQVGGGQAPAPAQAAPVAPGAVSGPAVPGTPAVTGAVPVPQSRGPVTAPVAPGAPQPAGARRPTMTDIEAGKTRAKEEAEVVGKDLGTVRANQPKTEEAADYLITKIDELVTHPGFGFSVGIANAGPVPLPGAGRLAGMIPGTDTSDWNARFKEVQGRQFLQAVETMRGTGALSDTEGKAATAAVARMSTSQSEKEFKEAVNDFKGIIQRGVDNNRAKLGQEPKYGTPAASETSNTSAPMSPADKARAELERRRKEKK